MNRDTKSPDALPASSSLRRSAPKPLTTSSINALKADTMLADGAIRPGAGSLKIRKRSTAGGVICEWLFEWSRDGKTVRHSMSRYASAESPGGLTLSQARAEAARLQAIVKAGGDPIAKRDAERHATRSKANTAKIELQHASEKNLSALLATYICSLQLRGKPVSAYDAENIFSNHISKPFPEIASLPAADVLPQHFTKILARLVGPNVEQKKGRTALKLRSYAAAAFKMALGASIDPMAPSSAKEFGLTINPVAAIPATSMAAVFNRAGHRVLSADELRHFWCYVQSLDAVLPRLVLSLQMATCGQRIQQLLRLTHDDVKKQTVELYDPKGKRLQPRLHVLPLLPEVLEVVNELRRINPPTEELGAKTPLFSSRDSVVALESISIAVQQISDAMVAKQLAVSPFQARDIRRTVETVLAETLMVSKDTRAQLLSHGLSGVQDRHYDKGAHLAAKAQAMRLWNDHIADLCIGTCTATAQHAAHDINTDSLNLEP